MKIGNVVKALAIVLLVGSCKESEKLSKVVEDYKKPTEKIVFVYKNGEEFSQEKLKELIDKLNLKYPEIVYAQAVLESGHFKSKSFSVGNNLFGMKVASIRPTTNSGEYLKHAKYSSWEQSVYDYALYQSTFVFKIKSKKDYYQYLKNNYAGDPTYVEKLKSIVSKEEFNV